MNSAGGKALGLSAKAVAAVEACRSHARALLDSAKVVQASGKHSIAYHLATLALEEIGKRYLLQIQMLASDSETPPAWASKHTQDHIKKLFWSFFGVELLAGTITNDSVERLRGLAASIHGKRLAGLYVDVTEDQLSLPTDAISEKDCEDLVELAEARLGMAEAEASRRELTEEEAALYTWFINATDDPDKRKRILSASSIKKLGEFKDSRAWTAWLKAQFDEAERASQIAVKRELERSVPSDDASLKDKWRFRIRLHCGSHSIRPKALSAWNKDVTWIRLSAVSGRKDQIDAEFILLNNVPAQALWHYGWGLARHFVVALNIGTMGFWWWRLPEFVDKYYTRMDDLENEMEMSIARSPSLKCDWGENRALNEEDLQRVKQCFVALPDPAEQDQHPAFSYYIGGITFLSLNEIHWQCEGQAFGNFFQSLRTMMKDYGGWLSADETFRVAFLRLVTGLFPNLEEAEMLADFCDKFGAEQPVDAKPTLKDVTFMKFFCDVYFMKHVQPQRLEKRFGSMQKTAQSVNDGPVTA